MYADNSTVYHPIHTGNAVISNSTSQTATVSLPNNPLQQAELYALKRFKIKHHNFHSEEAAGDGPYIQQLVRGGRQLFSETVRCYI